MVRCSPLGDAAATAAEVENIDEAAVATELEHAIGENPAISDGERYAASLDAKDNLNEGVSYNEKLWMCYFRSSTITVIKIKEMEEKGYFSEDEARAPGAKTVLEPNNNESIVYEDFFVAGLLMPSHPALADILLHS
jgi:hypothetical protein